MKKNCEVCGGPFDAKRRTAKYCSNGCRVQAQRGSGGESAPITALPTPQGASDGPVARSAREELAGAGREDTANGQLVLALARRIDAAEGESGASLAALVKEFRASLAAAVAGAETAADPLDELRMRRDGKRSG